MNLWWVTNIRVDTGRRLNAPAIQNLQTAAALADLGHGVLVWTDRTAGEDREAVEAIEAGLGRSVPPGMRLIGIRPRGREGEKRTPFSTALARAINLGRGRLGGPAPDVVVSRSPLALSQIRESRLLLGARCRLVLEYQYPEYVLLWRGWRKKHAGAGLGPCKAQLAELKRKEDAWIHCADGVLYAAHAHRALLRRHKFDGPSEWLPSGCAPVEDDSGGAGNAGVGDETPATSPAREAKYDIGYVGSVSPENGIETLIEAVAELKGVTLRIVGPAGPQYEKKLRALADNLGLSERVQFSGAVAHREVRAAMRECRVGVVPISARCGPEKRQFASPLKLIEWMAAGVPVVASSVPSVRQHATDGINALLFEPDRPEALGAALERALGDADLRGRLAAEGLRRAREASFSHRANRIVQFVEALSP